MSRTMSETEHEELKNFIERLIIMTPGEEIGAKDLPSDFMLTTPRPNGEPSYFHVGTLKEARSSFERDYLLRKLDENGWNISVTAARIGLERAYLHRKMKTLGIREEP